MFNNLSSAFDSLTEKTIDNFNKKLRKNQILLLADIIKKTPVDTGRARANWQMDTKLNDELFKEPRVESGDKAPKNVLNTKYFIFNNLPYINRLEYGWSEQAPNGMVRLSINKFLKRMK